MAHSLARSPRSSHSATHLAFAARWLLAIVPALMLTGCGNPAEDSRQHMHKLQAALTEYAHEHQDQWPDRLEQIKDKLGGDEAFKRIMANPLTGDNPGYEYVKPPAESDDTPAFKIIILYQLRAGKRDTTLKVGYADTSVRPFGDSGEIN